ncbi:DUF5930 domain-containing protein [Amaricoccus solimangrovi]|uniref:M23 family metallopeptidase n=1 Tax=Amaricoccus solimangrovi TaxID=2589815 RepID=A0A501WX81_9RHOB|nr:DUF5930 domain-containing protein [Amaricoccus solimangrovi]TPE52047.1 M23 family metallopeptidase [Amaricoccus solimangrovi]
MAGSERRQTRGLSAVLPEKRLTVHRDGAARHVTISPLSQLLLGLGGAAVLGWMTFSTAALLSGAVAPRGAAEVDPLRAAYEQRLDDLAAERDRRAHEASSAQGRFQLAMDQISRQQSDLLAAESEKRELSAALDAMRARLRDATAARETAPEDGAEAVVAAATPAGDLDDTIRVLSAELRDTAAARDAAAERTATLSREVSRMKLSAEIADKRRDQMIDRVEQAVAMSFGPLSAAMSSVDIDVDALIDAVRSNYSGEGGPVGAAVSTRNYDPGVADPRLDTMMNDLDRLNLLRVAAGKVPVAMPVHDAFRLTSTFGVRRDPKGAGRRMHEGIDLASPRGTAIYATADGVVTAAGRESGYGNVVRVRHDLGYETIYAHQAKIRVKLGQRVSRGDRIGDMGTTGRSTGVHLHYEVRLNGVAVNPLPYLEAAQHVQ